jgi:hypothetical protein
MHLVIKLDCKPGIIDIRNNSTITNTTNITSAFITIPTTNTIAIATTTATTAITTTTAITATTTTTT